MFHVLGLILLVWLCINVCSFVAYVVYAAVVIHSKPWWTPGQVKVASGCEVAVPFVILAIGLSALLQSLVVTLCLPAVQLVRVTRDSESSVAEGFPNPSYGAC